MKKKKKPGDIFFRNQPVDSKFIRKTKGPRIVKMISKKRSKVEGFILSDFKTSYDVIIIQKVLYWMDTQILEQN